MLTLFALLGFAYFVAALVRFLPQPSPGTAVGAAHGLMVGLRDLIRAGVA